MREVLTNIALMINFLSFFYVLLISSIYMLQLIAASISLKKYVKSLHYADYTRFINSDNMVPISVLVPAYNESASIIDSVKNLLSLDFPKYEVIVINDGSKDNTLELLMLEFDLIKIAQPFRRVLKSGNIQAIYRSPLYENLVVIDKENGGKADALNAGINVANYPVFVSIDADSILEKDSLIKIIYSFISDPTCVAVGGIVRISSGCKIVDGQLKEVGLSRNPLVCLQTTEYLRAFLTGRIGFDALGMLLIISGAFGAFSKNAVVDAGGYSKNCIGEDMELVVKLHKTMLEKKKPYSVHFIADPICWTQPPETYKDLKKQRKRWHIGLIDTLRRHKDMVLDMGYGRIGMICLPYYWIFELWGPVFETFGYLFVPLSWALGIVNLRFLITFFLVAVLYGVVLSIGALLLEENTFRKYPDVKQILTLLFYCIIDNFGYRQLNTVFKVLAAMSYRKNKSKWGEIKRTGFDGKIGRKPSKKESSAT